MKTKKKKKERKKMIVPTYRKLLMFGCMKKIKFIPNFFLEISQKYCKLVWVLRTCLAAPVKNYSINLWKALMLSSIKKLNSFPEISQRYCKLVWVFWACLAKFIIKDLSTCCKTLMFFAKSTSSFTPFWR